MACPYKFYNQCQLWKLFVLFSIPAAILTTVVGLQYGFTDWNLFSKVVIVTGTVTCVVWVLWIIKKLLDVANWWINLKEDINSANLLLAETRQHLQDIKQNL